MFYNLVTMYQINFGNDGGNRDIMLNGRINRRENARHEPFDSDDLQPFAVEIGTCVAAAAPEI
jgi:hypothetical protein